MSICDFLRHNGGDFYNLQQNFLSALSKRLLVGRAAASFSTARKPRKPPAELRVRPPQ
ncbi:hypothetical protein THICB1_100450 [Thiomonas arsenitoxydans]|uniref:Uncharacterized protein n=1 Tax=Thiomonas arsenitoxydans (strain DSM 22701 / CIP 110005 / 3As) TaxID=426114 RepID=A0ABP1Z3G0_THIA3|nr:hypothetical protein THICB1_100450 [Thiomonas arsenitoxydans]CQR29932.1 hypothetical protein ACO3_210017 [Thiomonas arsenitoxydans]